MYQINIEFNDSATHQEVTGWLNDIALPSLPENATATVNIDETTVFAEDLGEDHIGTNIRFTTNAGLDVAGNLDAIYSTTSDYARVLVVNGLAHQLTFGLVRVAV